MCIDFTVVDNLIRKNRFSLYYFLLSISFNKRLTLKTYLLNNFYVFFSLISIYGSLNWSEREVYDMFGIFFINHPSLRRILCDYGFKDFPLRKDFPCSGFYEKYFSLYKGYVRYFPIKISI
jgi:NADH:ubiquinone oxidoreductase subunit C